MPASARNFFAITHFGQVEVVNRSRPSAGSAAGAGAAFASSVTAEGAGAAFVSSVTAEGAAAGVGSAAGLSVKWFLAFPALLHP